MQREIFTHALHSRSHSQYFGPAIAAGALHHSSVECDSSGLAASKQQNCSRLCRQHLSTLEKSMTTRKMAAPHMAGSGATPKAGQYQHEDRGNWEQTGYGQQQTGQASVFNPASFAPAPAPMQNTNVYSPSSAGTGMHQRQGTTGQHSAPAGGQGASGGNFFGAGSSDSNMASAAGQMVAQAGLAQAQSLLAQYIPGKEPQISPYHNGCHMARKFHFRCTSVMGHPADLFSSGQQVCPQSFEGTPLRCCCRRPAICGRFALKLLSAQTLLFPFTKKQWQRSMTDGFEGRPPAPKLPIADTNAPDLYIPVMALVTYVLITGMAHGTSADFSPEVLINITSASLVTQLLELGLVLLVFILASVPRPAVLDCLAWCSNKYVGALLCNALYLLFGTVGFYVALLYTGAAMAFFLVQTLQGNLPPSPATNRNRHFAVLAVGGLQPLLIWWIACL